MRLLLQLACGLALNAVTGSAQQTPVADWPDESVVPGVSMAELPTEDQVPKTRDEIQKEIPGVERFQLRLNLETPIGTVHALTFTEDNRLCAAGDDKIVHVWARRERNGISNWLYERAIRWQVARGPVGQITALSCRGERLAFGGYGALLAFGEVIIVHPVTGELQGALHDYGPDPAIGAAPAEANKQYGHRMRIQSVAIAPQGRRVATQSADGQVNVWQQDANLQWVPIGNRPLWESENKACGLNQQRLTTLGESRGPIIMPTDDDVFIPVFQTFTEKQGANPSDIPVWRLRRYDLRDRTSAKWFDYKPPLEGYVTSLCAAHDGQLVIVTTWHNVQKNGFRFLFDRSQDNGQPVSRQPLIAPVVWSDITTDNTLVELALEAKTANRQLRLSKLIQNRIEVTATIPVGPTSQVCAVSRDGKFFASAKHNKIDVLRLPDAENKQVKLDLEIPFTPPIGRVEFDHDPPYRIRVALGDPRTPTQMWTFDPARLALESAPLPKQTEAVEGDNEPRKWRRVENRPNEWEIAGANAGYRFSFRPKERPTRHVWLPQGKKPTHIAVSFTDHSHIGLFRLREGDELCPLVRLYRGHEGHVTTLAVSSDHRYLLSGSVDGTASIWRLPSYLRTPIEPKDPPHESAEARIAPPPVPNPFLDRWGAQVQIVDGPNGRELVCQRVEPDGPFYFRSIRPGDVIKKLIWVDQQRGAKFETDQAADMLAVLNDTTHASVITFETTRPGKEGKQRFSLRAAWPPVATLFIHRNREWAFWTPAGYYSASFNGNKLFGWQLNPASLDELPRFSRATEFRRGLEQAEVMRQLLPSESLEEAMRKADVRGAGAAAQLLQRQFELQPKIAIQSPRPGGAIDGDSVTVEAQITTVPGQEIAATKVFANGVPAAPTIVGEGVDNVRLSFDAQLPSDPDILLQLLVTTRDGLANIESMQLHRTKLPSPRGRRLHVFAVVTGKYGNVSKLDFAESSLNGLKQVLGKRQTTSLGDIEIDVVDELVNESPEKIRSAAGQFRQQVIDGHVCPDDLIVIYAYGHGIRDFATDKYYYVTRDFRPIDALDGTFTGCLSLADFALFQDLPCRKLMIFDTCFSGIARPLQESRLLSAVRVLHEDMFLTLTACDDQQFSYEDPENRLGLFTGELIRGLRGAADANADGTVEFHEIAAFLQKAIPERPSATPQSPTAGPLELLSFVRQPLTGRGRHGED